ncbi:MAG: hypothetical protein WDM87_08920 [Terracidiphilus sp.]
MKPAWRPCFLRLIEYPESFTEKDQNGREAFIKNYDKPAGVARVMRAMGMESQATC